MAQKSSNIWATFVRKFGHQQLPKIAQSGHGLEQIFVMKMDCPAAVCLPACLMHQIRNSFFKILSPKFGTTKNQKSASKTCFKIQAISVLGCHTLKYSHLGPLLKNIIVHKDTEVMLISFNAIQRKVRESWWKKTDWLEILQQPIRGRKIWAENYLEDLNHVGHLHLLNCSVPWNSLAEGDEGLYQS